jgi:magnesium-transporting ATPase (P-type)
MIQQADVGIGVKGKEGEKACNAADYKVSKFSHI